MNNPLIFPIADQNTHKGSIGLTLRDWFAGLAMESMGARWNSETIALCSYEIADAMLKARDSKCSP